MPVTLSGNWTVQLISLPIDQPQRFVISGAQQGNGVYSDDYTTPISVIGNTWTIDFQEEGTWSGQPGFWISAYNIQQSSIETVGNQEIFYIHVDDYRGGVDFNDMVFKVQRPVAITIPEPPPPPPTITPPVSPPPTVPPVIVPPVPEVIQPGKVWTVFPAEDKIARETEITYRGIWAHGSGSLLEFYTGSSITDSTYRIQVFNAISGSCGASSQFEIAYGHCGGSGSKDLGGIDYLTPSKAIYSQYRQICLDPTQNKFKIGRRELNHIYVIDLERDRMQDKMDPGNLELNLAHLSGSFFLGGRNSHTGSNVKLAGNGQILRLIDDSVLNFEEQLSDFAFQNDYIEISASKAHRISDGTQYFYLVSGSLEDGILFDEATPIVFGLFYPSPGVLILDGDRLDQYAGFLTATGSDSNGMNIEKMYKSISGSALYTDLSGDYLGFQARRIEVKYSEYFYVRVKNFDYNHSNNPTWVSGSEQYLLDEFQNGKNKVYITGVGLYNDNHELLAIGKLSQPILKTPSEEALLQVCLSYGPDNN